MDINNFFRSKGFMATLWILGCLIILLLVFKAGMFVGFRKAGFSYRWGENYHRNFGGPRGGVFRGMFRDDFPKAFGAFGQIMKIDGATLVVKDRDNVEKIVVVKDTTSIQRFRKNIANSDLHVDDFIAVIGEPNDDGQIEAKFIRVMPSSQNP